MKTPFAHRLYREPRLFAQVPYQRIVGADSNPSTWVTYSEIIRRSASRNWTRSTGKTSTNSN